jgi:uncharacterized protein with FMN-binding domain
MKSVYSSVVALLLAASSYAQTATPTPQTSNCYTRWEEKFEQRGAMDVKDGVYTDVIISVRSGPEAQCYSGKVEVKDGKIISMQRKLADGTYEAYKPKLKYEIPMTITTGISATLLTMDDDLINVIFPATLKPKKVAYSTAPDPPQD